MDFLPDFSTKRIAIKVKKTVERQIRMEHPWVYQEAIIKQSGEAQAGDLAIIYDHKKNKFLALGLYDPDSPIRIKLLQFHKAATIDEDWFRQKVEAAFAIRRPLFVTDTNSYRLIFGENDGLPSFIADVYANVLVVKLYSAIWIPYLKLLLPILKEVTNATSIVLRLSRGLQPKADQLHGLFDGQILWGELPEEEVQFKEHGLHFMANVIKGHKTGYFLDHRHNRKQIGDWAKGKSVLDVFSYNGGFSVHAFVGGASEVISLDISAKALADCERNIKLNQGNGKHQILAADAFKGMQQLALARKQFDIVIVDPPAFAKSHAERAKALKNYQRLATLAIPLVQSKGKLVLASCSSRIPAEEFFELMLATLAQSKRAFREIKRTQHDVDHPITFKEGAYLKCIFFQL